MKKLDVVLVADTELTRTLGLMRKPPLEKYECAYFDFPNTGRHAFWNKNVNFPISVIFCDKDRNVIDIQALGANQLSSISPIVSGVKYVIEAHKDLPFNMGLENGSRFKICNREIVFG